MKEFIDSTNNVSAIALSEEDRQSLMYFGALEWSEADIAAYFGWDAQVFHSEFINPVSEISKVLMRGRLENRSKIETRLTQDAISGNLTAAKQFADIIRDKSFQHSKLDIFGGPADEGAFQRIQDYIAGGSRGELSNNEQLYIDILVMVYSLDGQYGKRNTIRFLTRKPFSFSYEKASSMYAEALEMFYANRQVSKQALQAKFSERFDTLYALTMASAKTPKDYEIAGNLLMQQAKVLRLDQQDVEKLPAEQYQKQYRLLSLNTENIGLPPANRDLLASQIDSLTQPDAIKKRLRMEAGIEDVDIIEILENVVQEEN